MDHKASRLLLCCLVILPLLEAVVYVSDPARTNMIEFHTNNKPCRIITDGTIIRDVLGQTSPRQVHMVDSHEMMALADMCHNAGTNTLSGAFLFPGTKWCGPGNTARSYDDLGEKSDVDQCCRAHDHCPVSLEPGQCRRGICNVSPFTKSHCDCDTAFKKCLREVNSNTARLIATLYFDVAQLTCFKDRRSCPPWMRNDLSYTWFCDEWKFVPVDGYIPPPIVVPPSAIRLNLTNEASESGSGKREPSERSRIDQDLHALYKTDEDAERVMDNPKPKI